MTYLENTWPLKKLVKSNRSGFLRVVALGDVLDEALLELVGLGLVDVLLPLDADGAVWSGLGPGEVDAGHRRGVVDEVDVAVGRGAEQLPGVGLAVGLAQQAQKRQPEDLQPPQVHDIFTNFCGRKKLVKSRLQTKGNICG